MTDRISLIKQDITKLPVDAIVNAANSSLLGGGGVDGAIHRAAGPLLLEECRKLGGCKTGDAKITAAYQLPSKYIIHTAGPVWKGGTAKEQELLKSCYTSCLQLACEYKLDTIAFPNISTGIYGFPKRLACEIAVSTVSNALKEMTLPGTVYFICFDEENFILYREALALRVIITVKAVTLHLRNNNNGFMKNTPFTQKHTALGAKMAEFAGYNMPISYTGINDEHQAVRTNAGVFDVSHMGEFILKGPAALDLIQRVTSNDASKLTDGKAQYSCLPNHEGGIVDDLIVYCIEQNNVYMLVVNAGNIDKDWNWISSFNVNNVEMHNISAKTCLLAIQGPNACKILQPLTEIDICNLNYYTFVKGIFAGVSNVLVSATGYTGSGGVEIYFEDKDANADKIWNAIFDAGKTAGIKPIGLGARDTLRLEMGYCLYGNDIDDTTSPLEAGLGWITKFNKSFTNSESLLEQKNNGISRKLVGLEMMDKGIPRHGYQVINSEGNLIGIVTSGTQAPSLSKAIAMAYIEKDYYDIDSEVYVDIRGKMLKAKVVKMPFR